jgi:hypothetical protein
VHKCKLTGVFAIRSWEPVGARGRPFVVVLMTNLMTRIVEIFLDRVVVNPRVTSVIARRVSASWDHVP